MAPVPEVLPKVMLESVLGKRANSVSSSARLHAAPPHEVEVMPLPRPIVVLLVFGWITKAPLPVRLPPRASASVVRVRLKVLAASVEPVVIAEADKVVAAVSDAASL